MATALTAIAAASGSLAERSVSIRVHADLSSMPDGTLPRDVQPRDAPGAGAPAPSASTPRADARWSADLQMPLLAALVVIAVGAVRLAWEHPYEINSDEGINALKALALSHGYPLYTAVWDDQPPLYTELLRAIMKACGWTMMTGRAMTLAFAGILAAASYDCVRLAAGHRAAVAAQVLLWSGPYAMVLAGAMMIGLPALACAVVSLWALMRWDLNGGRRAARPWLLLSGAALGLGLGIKFFVGIIVVATALAWWRWRSVARDGREQRERLGAAALWALAAAAAAACAMLPACASGALDQMFASHLAAEHSQQAAMTVIGYLERSWALSLPAAIGAVVVLARGTWPWMAVLAWWLLALVVLGLHRPLWWHHTLLATVPASLLAGRALGWLFALECRPRGLRSWCRGLALLALGAAAAWEMATVDPLQRPGWWQRDDAVLAQLRAQHACGIMVSDRDFFPFALGCDMPPELVVASWARITAKALSEQQILESIRRDRPCAVVLTDRWQPSVIAAVQRGIAHGYHLTLALPAPARCWCYARDPDGATASVASTP